MIYSYTLKNVDKEELILAERLSEYNTAHQEKADTVPIAIYIEDDKGEKKGGITGYAYGNWLAAKYLWISDELRGMDMGTKLIRMFEAEGIKRGCKKAFLMTFSYQAPGFYKKMGFTQAFSMDEYPYTFASIYFTKDLPSVPPEISGNNYGYNFRLTTEKNDREVAVIVHHLANYNATKQEKAPIVPFAVFLKDENGEKKGGISGFTYGNWLIIKYFWVSEELRRRGYGTRLIAMAEEEAKKLGCKYSYLPSYSFQAPDFFRKLNYKDLFSQNDYPFTDSLTYFKKNI